jgi:hypothetical protein
VGNLERKLRFTPKSKPLIEKVAAELAGTWYEVGRGQGMTSKYKSARAYARANIEKFVPKAVEILIDMLGKPDTPEIMKAEIYEALMERINDPDLHIFDKMPTNLKAN